MKKLNSCRSAHRPQIQPAVLFATMLLGCLLHLPATAQTPAPAVQPATATAPLNLDSEDVAKELSKGQHPADTKAESLSSTQDTFEQSLLNAENSKKVSGFVAAGGTVGNVPAQHGFKSENFNCENTAVGINDEINRNTQVSVYADASTCRLH